MMSHGRSASAATPPPRTKYNGSGQVMIDHRRSSKKYHIGRLPKCRARCAMKPDGRNPGQAGWTLETTRN